MHPSKTCLWLEHKPVLFLFQSLLYIYHEVSWLAPQLRICYIFNETLAINLKWKLLKVIDPKYLENVPVFVNIELEYAWGT